MAKINQFGGVPGAPAGGGRDCLPFEAMLADAIDGTLSASEQARFEDHLATCEQCPIMLADAQRGRALLEMLRPEVVEPSPALLNRIFAQTTVRRAQEEEAARAERRAAHEADSLLGTRPLASFPVAAATLPTAGTGLLPGAGTGKVLPFRERLQTRLRGARHTVFQPRFAMTAAMAFFSIALTLNLSGIRVGQLRFSDLRPGNVKRGVYEARARVVRYYANLRVVYELESRVHDLQRSDDDSGRSSAPAAQKPQTQPAPDSNSPPDRDGKGGASAPAPASPGPGKTENPDGTKPRPGIPEPPRSSRNRPNSGTSRCSWPLPGLQEVRFQRSPREGSRPPQVAVQLHHISEPHGKRGLA